MKVLYVFIAVLLVVCSAFAQQGDNLPSAPSAVVAPKKTQTPPPPPQQPEQKPAQPPGDLMPAPDSAQPAAPAKPAEPPAAAATAPAAANDGSLPESETFRVRANEVNVVFTVTDRRGRYIKDLKKEDVRVLDNKQAIKELRAFAAQSNLPLRVGLLIDASSSIRDRFKFEQEAAIEFLNSIIRPRQDQAFVVSFDSVVNPEMQLSNDVGKLSTAVRNIRPGGGTALYDAVYSSCRDILMKHPENTPVRRAIILLSDGEDTQSRVLREEAIEMAQRAEVIIFTISTALSNTVFGGDKTLERMADQTGGRSFHPLKLEEVSDAFTDIQDELRSQYALAYKPEVTDSAAFRSIDIEVPGKKYKVRARKGYFPKR